MHVESELLHTYSKVYKSDVVLLIVRLAVLTAVTLTVPVVLFPVSPTSICLSGWRLVSVHPAVLLSIHPNILSIVKFGIATMLTLVPRLCLSFRRSARRSTSCCVPPRSSAGSATPSSPWFCWPAQTVWSSLSPPSETSSASSVSECVQLVRCSSQNLEVVIEK